MTLSAVPGSLRTLTIWLCCLGALVIHGGPIAHAADWPKINKAELAETTPKIDPEAGAEILLRDAVLDYTTLDGSQDTHYIRAKIFTERGIKYFSLVKIRYNTDEKIEGLMARTIKCDGTIIDVKSEDIHNREEHRDNEGRVRTKTFAFPSLEPGVIVEYKYYLTSRRTKYLAPINFQSHLPTRLVRYKVGMLKPTPSLMVNADIRAISYNCPNQVLKARDGFYKFEFTDLPAIKKEPYAPPAIMNCTAMLVYLSLAKNLPPDEFWRSYSKELHKKYSSALKPRPDVTAKAVEIVSDAGTPEEKLKKLYDWCRTSITNLGRDTTRLSAEQRKALKKNDDASDVLKSKIGTSRDINLLFISLARAAGFDARIAECNNRDNLLFSERITEPNFLLSDSIAAVQLGGKWTYLDPGSTYLPFGQLRSRNTDTAILVSDPNGTESPIIVPGEPPERNMVQRKADFRLSAAGTLEGDVTEIYSGQEDYSLKSFLDDKSPEKRADYFRSKLVRQFKQTRVTNIVVENAADPLANIKVTYHIRIPAYAEKTGTRLFIQPAVFQKGGVARLSLPDGERKSALIFPFRHLAKDEIDILIPTGYTLEAASAPAGISVGGLCDYDNQLTFNRVTHTLTCRRELSLTNIFFKNTGYAGIKGVLNKLRERDDHTLTIKRDETVAAPEETEEKPEPGDEEDPKSPGNEENKSNTDFAP